MSWSTDRLHTQGTVSWHAISYNVMSCHVVVSPQIEHTGTGVMSCHFMSSRGPPTFCTQCTGVVSCHVMLCRGPSTGFTHSVQVSCNVMSYYVVRRQAVHTGAGVMSCHVMWSADRLHTQVLVSCHVMLCGPPTVCTHKCWCHAKTRYAVSCHVVLYHVMRCHFVYHMSSYTMPCHAMTSFHILCHITHHCLSRLVMRHDLTSHIKHHTLS